MYNNIDNHNVINFGLGLFFWKLTSKIFVFIDSTPGAELKKKTKKKKKRKIRLPKNYNPDVPPDPERWLPRWQRKTFRKKRDRRGKDVMKGTQGVSSDAADK